MSPARALKTVLPIELLTDVWEEIAKHLDGSDKVHLALCCKAMLPTLCTGAVSVRLDEPPGEEPLIQLTHCLSRQPGGVSHLSLFSIGDRGDTLNLIDLSLLSNLRELSLENVCFSLPALQPVATRLHCLTIRESDLHGSAAGFLSVGWTSLKSLSINACWVKDHDDVPTVLNLPALESLDMNDLKFGDLLEKLQPDQLCCPQLSSLVFDFYDTTWVRGSQEAQASESGRQRCSLVHLPLLATLDLSHFYDQATPTDLGLPASLKHLTVREIPDAQGVDLKWVLLEAVTGIRSGAQLRSLTCFDSVPSSHPEGMPWGASSLAHYLELAEQLRGLTDLSVYGSASELLSAVGALACAGPDLTRLEFGVDEELEVLDDLEIPPICSASLKSFTGRFYLMSHEGPPPPVILTFLPGCTQLHDVHVQVRYNCITLPKKGAFVKIRCYSSQQCIVPLEDCVRLINGFPLSEVAVRFLPVLPSSKGVMAYTVIFTCHATGPVRALKWSHVIKPGFL